MPSIDPPSLLDPRIFLVSRSLLAGGARDTYFHKYHRSASFVFHLCVKLWRVNGLHTGRAYLWFNCYFRFEILYRVVHPALDLFVTVLASQKDDFGGECFLKLFQFSVSEISVDPHNGVRIVFFWSLHLWELLQIFSCNTFSMTIFVIKYIFSRIFLPKKFMRVILITHITLPYLKETVWILMATIFFARVSNISIYSRTTFSNTLQRPISWFSYRTIQQIEKENRLSNAFISLMHHTRDQMFRQIYLSIGYSNRISFWIMHRNPSRTLKV